MRVKNSWLKSPASVDLNIYKDGKVVVATNLKSCDIEICDDKIIFHNLELIEDFVYDDRRPSAGTETANYDVSLSVYDSKSNEEWLLPSAHLIRVGAARKSFKLSFMSPSVRTIKSQYIQ